MSSRVLNADVLTSHGNVAGREDIVEILEAGLQAADPYYTTKRMLRISGDRLIVGGPDYVPLGDPNADQSLQLELGEIDRIFVFGAAKGSSGTPATSRKCWVTG